MKNRDQIRKHLSQAKLMQIATVGEQGPWICTVYFVADDSFNLYWLSYPGRRHSKELAANNKAAVAIAVKADQPVIGIQAEGRVEIVTQPSIVKKTMEHYVATHSEGRDFYQNFLKGSAKHRLYKFTPIHMQLFDEQNYKAESPLAVL